MGNIEELLGTFYLRVISCAISSIMNRQKRPKQWMTTSKQWSCLRKGDTREYLLQFVTIQCIQTKCVLNTLQFAHVETGQTPEQRAALVQTTTH